MPSHITAYSLLWEGCVRPGSIMWLMLPYAGNTRKDIGLCWEPSVVWNESSSWILCSVARRMLRQLQSCIEFSDRSFCLCSALGSLCFHVWAIQSAELHNELLLLAGHPSNKNSSYLVSQNVIANKWVWKRLQKNISTSLSKCCEAWVGREAVGEVPGTKLSF